MSQPKFTPKHNQVIIKQLDSSEQRIGAIIVPDVGKERPRIGIVIAIGVGTFTINGNIIPIQVKVGEKVAFPSFGGVVFQYDGDDYVAIKDTDLIAGIEE